MAESDSNAIETLFVRLEADMEPLLQGTEDAVAQAKALLERLNEVRIQLNIEEPDFRKLLEGRMEFLETLSSMGGEAGTIPAYDVDLDPFNQVLDETVEKWTAVTAASTEAGKATQQTGNIFNRLGQQAKQVWANISQSIKQYVNRMRESQDVTTAFDKILQMGMQKNATEVQLLMSNIVQAHRATGDSIEDTIRLFEKLPGQSQRSIDQVRKNFKDLIGDTEATKTAFTKVGEVLKKTFSLALGFEVFRQLQSLVKQILATADAAIKAQAAVVRLEVAIRAAQRVTGESVGTISEWKDTIAELREEFQTLNETALSQGAAQVAFVTRELGFNQEQMEKTLEAASTLSAVYGIELHQAINLVVQGLTGLGRGLRMYGVFVNKAGVTQEGLRMGLVETGEAMTTQEKAAVALSLITQQTGVLNDDLSKTYETLGGRVRTAQASMTDSAGEMGKDLAFLKALWNEAAATFLEKVAVVAQAVTKVVLSLTRLTSGIRRFVENAIAIPIRSVAKGLEELAGIDFQNVVDFLNQVPFVDIDLEGPTDLIESWNEAWAETNEEFMQWSRNLGLVEDQLPDVTQQFADLGEELGDLTELELGEIALELAEDIEKAFDKYEESLLDAYEDLEQALAEADRDLQYAQEDAARERAQALEDLAIDVGRRRADIYERTQQRLEDLERQTQDRRAQIHTRYGDRIIQIEENFQRQMRLLRQRFNEDFRDALARRDAFAAVQAIRRYRIDRANARDDRQRQRRSAARDRDRQLKELDLQQKRQRESIMRDQERQLEDLAIYHERRRDEIDEDFRERLEDAKRQHLAERIEAQLDYDRKRIQLRNAHNQRLADIAAALTAEEGITRQGAQAIFLALDQVFGLGGQIDQMMSAFEQRMSRRIEIEVAVRRAAQSTSGDGVRSRPDLRPEQMQTGGAVIARRPTLIEFGEAGPEIATFAPMNVFNKLTEQREHLGELDINITADEHFSIDFEERVENAIVDVVQEILPSGR